MAGFAQYPVVEFGDQAIGFGNADKALWPQQAMLRMVPADQGFEFGYLATFKVEYGLVMQEQPVIFTQGMAQLFFDLQLKRGAGFEA